MTLHAHIGTAARDCDGLYTGDYVLSFNDAEIAESQKTENNFVDITFRERVACSLMHVTGGEGTLTVTSEPGGWATRMVWHQQTEEGYRSAEAVFCEEDWCDPDERHQRDHSAEAAGY